ncbi:Lead, cadmium, zinc and mercury transporting ATPase [Lachnospiraceae bacterium TWA4]|nr:Lead, cadmium, zinc and mercury transporting ATPase [Lachnospiraceae bacterium TWA4]
MKKTLKIEGMKCCNCERHAREALEAINGVTVEKVSHDENVAVIDCAEDVSEATLKAAIEEEAGYTFLGVE